MEYRQATKDDIELFMELRLEMLRAINSMYEDEEFSQELIDNCRDYFLNGDSTTVFAFDGDKPAGCASICYISTMPTYSHPTGRRANLMNVYVKPDLRRQGVAQVMVKTLIREAKDRGVTEISLDATEEGRPLYSVLGFRDSEEGMVLVL